MEEDNPIKETRNFLQVIKGKFQWKREYKGIEKIVTRKDFEFMLPYCTTCNGIMFESENNSIDGTWYICSNCRKKVLLYQRTQ